MGGAQSSEQGQYGFHVLKVKENSPAFHAGIEQFFDYIVKINGISLNNGDSQTLLKTLQEYENKPLSLTIYSSKEQVFRDITLTPSRDWHPNDPNEKSLIGCSIRFCSFERAGENVWHVLDVSPNSPAEMAGIIPYSDYIIGSPHMTLRNEDDFYSLVEEYLGKPLRLYLYNSEWDSCRECIIVPNHEWGGNGSLGCDVGYGLLHRIPRKKSEREVDGTVTEEERQRSDSINYSDTIFNAPELNNSDEEAENTLNEAKQTELPASPAVNEPSTSKANNEQEVKESSSTAKDDIKESSTEETEAKKSSDDEKLKHD